MRSAVAVLTASAFIGVSVLTAPLVSAAEGEYDIDPATITSWQNGIGTEGSIESLGRIWSDKSVYTDSFEVTLDDGSTLRIDSDDDEFLVSLAAMSSARTVHGTVSSVQPLDITIVLDVSRSMRYCLGSGTFNQSCWNGQPDGSDMSYNSPTNKLNLMKDAVNDFIDQIEEANATIHDESLKHRTSIVKFASNKSTTTGNTKYWSSGDDAGKTCSVNNVASCQNYTQIVQGLTSDTSTLHSKVNALDHGGVTRADYAFDRAEQVFKDAREDAQPIVIFFTDGEPTSSSAYMDSIASSALASAKRMKDEGALIYSIGVFGDASSKDPVIGNATATTTKMNQYLHGLSSNYPNATATNKLGERATDSNYYFAVNSEASHEAFDEIFQQIWEEINDTARSPIESEDGSMGYVTITDELGEYMTVRDLKTVTFAGQRFDQVESHKTGNITKYTFSGEVAGNEVYGAANLNELDITVEDRSNGGSSSDGDIITVRIPADLLPLRLYEVTVDGDVVTTSWKNARPIAVFFTIGVRDGVNELLENPDEAMSAYIEQRGDGNGNVSFMSNYYEEGSVNGSTLTTFEPAKSNEFYYFVEDMPLYASADESQPVTSGIDAGTTYYYKQVVYVDNAEKTEWVPVSGADIANLTSKNSEGVYQIDAGSKRPGLEGYTVTKTDNSTGTASTVIAPTWDGDIVAVSLGNNGRVTFPLPEPTAPITTSVDVKAQVTLYEADLEPGMFSYEMTAVGDAPAVPEAARSFTNTGGASDGEDFVWTPEGLNSLLEGVEFTVDDIGKTFTYVLTQIRGDDEDMEYDETPVTLEVTISAEYEGDVVTELLATSTMTKGNWVETYGPGETAILPFYNSYYVDFGDDPDVPGAQCPPGFLPPTCTPITTSVDVKASVTLYEADLEPGMFSYEMTAEGDAPALPDAALSFANTGSASDGDAFVWAPDGLDGLLDGIEFTIADIGKTYTYVLTQLDGGDEDFEYDKTPVTLAVTISAEYEDGSVVGLLATSTMTKGSWVKTYESGQTVILPFYNSYYVDFDDDPWPPLAPCPPGTLEPDCTPITTSVTVKASVTLYDADLEPGMFSYVMEAQGDAPALPTAALSFVNTGSASDGDAFIWTPDGLNSLLDGITFTVDDIGKTYTYVLTQIPGDDEDMEYDKTPVKLEVTISAEYDGDSITGLLTTSTVTRNSWVKTYESGQTVIVPFYNSYYVDFDDDPWPPLTPCPPGTLEPDCTTPDNPGDDNDEDEDPAPLPTTSAFAKVSVVLHGRALNEGDFSYMMVAQGDAPAVPEHAQLFTNPAANDGEEVIWVPSDRDNLLADIEFTVDDIGKTYTYMLYQNVGDLEGVTYDSTPVKLEVTIEPVYAEGLTRDATVTQLLATPKVTKGESESAYQAGETAILPFVNYYAVNDEGNDGDESEDESENPDDTGSDDADTGNSDAGADNEVSGNNGNVNSSATATQTPAQGEPMALAATGSTTAWAVAFMLFLFANAGVLFWLCRKREDDGQEDVEQSSIA